ncbi:MAG: PP2C family protein-serine/threonine phosphatase, partial [Gammaproteobacteria bacterium]
ANDNPEMLFITVFAGLLHLDSGEMHWSNAGHDSPIRLEEGTKPISPFRAVGPPLCVVDDYIFDTQIGALCNGAALCLMTDGVTEAQNRSAELFGGQRVVDALARLPAAAGAAAIVAQLKAAVDEFVGSTEQADDITVLCLRRPIDQAID